MGYLEIKKQREQALELSIQELERLAEENKDKTHYLSQEAYKLGLAYAIREIEGWERLQIKAHETAPYANPKEAEREHQNMMRLLAVIKSKLIARFQGKP